MLSKLFRRASRLWVAERVSPSPEPERTRKKIFRTKPDPLTAGEGYSAADLNDYIVKKTELWMREAGQRPLALPRHQYGQLFVFETVRLSLGRPIRVCDFGGGVPFIPWIANQLGIELFESYTIVEQDAFVRRTPSAWERLATFTCEFTSHPVDIFVISSVLPYIDASLESALFENLHLVRPRYIYLGRTSFLPENYPDDEVYTIQESLFKYHGPQIPTGMEELEERFARYVHRHIKQSSITNRLSSLGYQRKASLVDDSGIDKIDGLDLYADNTLWERIGETAPL